MDWGASLGTGGNSAYPRSCRYPGLDGACGGGSGWWLRWSYMACGDMGCAALNSLQEWSYLPNLGPPQLLSQGHAVLGVAPANGWARRHKFPGTVTHLGAVHVLGSSTAPLAQGVERVWTQCHSQTHPAYYSFKNSDGDCVTMMLLDKPYYGIGLSFESNNQSI